MHWKSFLQQMFSWRCFLAGTGVGVAVSLALSLALSYTLCKGH